MSGIDGWPNLVLSYESHGIEVLEFHDYLTEHQNTLSGTAERIPGTFLQKPERDNQEPTNRNHGFHRIETIIFCLPLSAVSR